MSFFCPGATYDAAGTLKKQRYQHTNGALDSMEYVYDNLTQLTQFKHETVLKRSYAYDDNGNLTTFTGKTLTYGNKNNQLTSDGSRNFTFDEVGRAKQIGSTNLSYDIFNNMTDHGSDSYAYDAFNQRIRKTEDDTSTYYVTSGPQILAEYTSDADPDAEYIYGLSGMAVRFDPAVGHHWFFTDHLGSTREMGLPETSGDPDMLRDYYPYGDNYAVAGNDETAYQFTGKELDNGIGLHYFGSRYYDRSIGRWLAPDPAGQYFSPYAYAGNSPLNFVDADGELAFIPLAIAAFTVLGGVQGYQAGGWQGALVGASQGFNVQGGLTVATAGVASTAGTIGASLTNGALYGIDAARQGAGGGGIARSVFAGAASGYLSASGFGGLAVPPDAVGLSALGRNLGAQVLSSSSRSILNNFGAGRNLFSSVKVGVGPATFNIGKGGFFQWSDNRTSIASQGLVFENSILGGIADARANGSNFGFRLPRFDWQSLSFYSVGGPVGGAMRKLEKWTNGTDAFTPYAMFFRNQASITDAIDEEIFHMWQSRLWGQGWLIHFLAMTPEAIKNRGWDWWNNFHEQQYSKKKWKF